MHKKTRVTSSGSLMVLYRSGWGGLLVAYLRARDFSYCHRCV